MFKKLLMAVLTLVVTTGFAFAGVEVNSADQAALDGIKGIGPAKSKAILAERSKGGNFKDWADFEVRVKGVGAKNAVKFSEAGLIVNGQAKSGAVAKAEPKSEPKAAAPAKADMKAPGKVTASK
jgi:competence protein ComEA